MEATMFLLLLLVVGASSGPVNWKYQNDVPGGQQCSTHCTNSNKFLYETGKTYIYQYETKTLTHLSGVTDGVARIDIKATASISVLSKCEMLLSLSQVSITSSDSEKNELQPVNDLTWKSALENNDLRFSFQDGRVEELCPSSSEETNSLNFKRGVLSAFQNSMNQQERDESMREIDIAGVCPTEYTVTQKGWKSSQFTKTKDLLGCTDRYDYRTSLQSTPFRLPDSIQSLPLMKGSHKCIQTLSKQGYVQSTSCTESLVFRPFSRQEAGARTESSQKLTFTNSITSSLKRTEPVTSKSTLLFEHKQTLGSIDQNLWATRQKFTELCRVTVHDITPEVPGLFADLVYLMRGLQSKDLLDIADRVERGNICEENKSKVLKFYQDALAMVGTTASIDVMTGMLLAKQVTDTRADLWINSLHFVQSPKVAMLIPLKNLLLSEQHRLSSLLPVSSLIHNLCQEQTNCLAIPEVGDIVDVLSNYLGTNCQSVEQNLLLTTLRAIGNLGYADTLSSTLEKCVKSTENSMNARVTAVQAYRGLSCNVDRKTLMNIFLDVDEDSELRIASYLGVMQCWDNNALIQIKKALEKEEVNQVGSFVWSHLTNLMETSSVHKQALKDILNDETLNKEFNIDRRKYSRNYETSFFSEKFGIGAMVESNLIWSSKSFLPRSGMVNLTVDVLGHSVNLFEFGGRIQGIETFLQNYFGADGVFGGQKPKDNAPSRCVKQEKMDSMKKKFSVDKDELTASIYLRMFGNELGFQHFTENDLTSLKNKYSIKEILASLAKGQDVSITKSAMFMDTSVSVPTIAGIPLTLSINGTATVELVANGKMDMKKFSLRKMEANFELKPSGAVQISGMMSVNAGSTRAGLKMVTTLHTSTSLSGSLDLTNGQVLSADLDTPKRNLEILNIKSEMFLLYNKAEVKQEVTKNKNVAKTSCSSESVLKVLGYELCGAVSFINASADTTAPYFPLTGPVNFAITLHKKDVPKGFRFLGKLIHNKATSIAQMSFDTPGSLVERAINIGYFLDTTVKSAEVELNSPWKKILVKGSYNDDPKSRKFTAVVLDDGDEYNFHIQLDKDKQETKTVYTPTLELSRPPKSKVFTKTPEKLNVGGTISIEDDYSDISGVISIKSGIAPDPIELKANYVNKQRENTLSGSLTLNQKKVYSATFQVMKNIAKGKTFSGKLEPTILISTPSWRPFLLSGSVEFREDKLLDTNFKITMDQTLTQPINVDVKFTKQKKKALDRMVVESNLDSQFGTVRAKGYIEISRDATKKIKLLSTKINLDYNLSVIENKNFQKNKVTISVNVEDKSLSGITKYEASIDVDSKNYQDASFISNFELTQRDVFTKAILALKMGSKSKFTNDKSHELRLEFSMNHELKNDSADIKYGLQILYPVMDIEYEIKGKHEHQLKNKFFFETYNAVIFGKGKSLELRVIGNSNNKKNNLDASGSLELNYPEFEIDGRKYDSRSYRLSTSIIQNADKEYIHIINLQVNHDDKHSLVTKFKKQSDELFDLYSQLHIARESPMKLTVTASRDYDNLKGTLEFFMNNDVYSGALISKSIEDKYQTHSWDFVWPERRVKGSIEAGQKQERSAIVKFETFWDADRDPTQKILFEINYGFESGKRVQKSEMSMTLTTPFEDHKIYSYKRQVDLTMKEFKDEFKIIWRKVDNELSYSLWVLLPPSMERFEIKSKIVTPLESLRRVGFDIVHKFDGSRYLSSTYKGMFNDDEMTVGLLISNTGDKVRNVIESSFTFSSTLPEYRNFILKFRHSDDGRTYSTEALYEKNGEQYKSSLDATYFRVHYLVNIDSKLEISFPSDKPIVIKLVHANTLTNLNSTVSFNWKPGYDTKFVVGVKFNNAEKDYAFDIILTGPWKEFSIAEIQLRHNMLIDSSGSYFIRINREPKLTSKGTYKVTNSELICEFTGRTQGTLKVQYGNYPYTLFLEKTIQDINIRKWEEFKIVLEASLDKSYYNGWSANAKLVTPWEEAKSITLRGNVQKTSESLWKVDSVITMGVRKHITADFSLDVENLSQMHGTIKTPYKELNSMNFGFSKKYVDKVYNSETFLEIQPIFKKIQLEQTMSIEPDFITRYHLDLPDTEFKFIEININHAKQRRGYDTGVRVNYHPEKEINVHFNGKFNNNKFPENTKVTFDVATPFDVLPNFNTAFEINKDEEKWIGLVDLILEAEDFKNLKIKMTHSNTNSSFDNDLEIESSLTEAIGVGLHFNWGDMAAANLSLNAPSVGRTMVGFKKNSKSWTDFQHKVFAEFSGYNLDVDIGLKHDEKMTRFWLLYAYPGSEQSYLHTNIHRIGDSAHDFDVGGFLQVGKNSRPYNISMQYSLVDAKTAFGTTLETPFTKHVSYLVKNEKLPNEEYVTILYGKYDTNYLIDTYLSQMIDHRKLNINTRNQFLFGDRSYKTGTKLFSSCSQDEQEATIEAYFNDEWTNAKMNRKLVVNRDSERNETFDLLLFTPYEDFTDIGMHYVVTIEKNHYQGTYNLEYMDEKEAILTFDVTQPNKNNANVEATLVLPIEGYDSNTLSYQHTNRKNLFSANAEIITGKGEHLNGKLEYKNNEDYTLTLTGPIEKFESLVVNGKFNEKEKTLTGNAQIQLTVSSKPALVEFDAQISKLSAINFKIRSPFQGFQFADLAIQHEGQEWKQFKNKALFKTDSIGQVISETSWTFNSIANMECKTLLTSSVKNMENLKFVFSTNDLSGRRISQINIGWQKDREISLNNSWSLNKVGDNTKFTTNLAIATPFSEIKSANIKLAHIHSNEMLSEGFAIAHNNYTYLDTDLSYQYGSKNEAIVEVRSPRPMALLVTGSAANNHLDGTVNINWDKRLPEAQVEIITSLNDRSDFHNIDKEFKLKVIHPVRIMELDSSYKKANNEILSTGHLSWDKEYGNTLSYDIAWTNRTSVYSQMYEGHIKLGVPQRSVKVQGSYSDSSSSVITNSAFWWDADRDEKKKVTMSSSVETRENLKRVVLNINLPSVNKQLNIDGTTRGGYGSTIVDSRAEVAYSSDPKKRIIVTSKLGNTEINSPVDYNYTMDFGFEHAVTNLNIKLSTHLANVGRVSSIGSQLALLATNNEMKNINFWAKVDRAQRNMEVKVATPMKTVAVVGQIDNTSNQRRILLKSFEDDKQAMKLDVIVDQRRQNLDVEFNYDQDDQNRIVKLTGNFVNNSAVRVDLISQDGKQTTSESMIAVRLNTSHILYTRLFWRPTLLPELQNFVGTKLTAFSYAANEALAKAVDTVGSEVKAKYLVVSGEMNSEMSHVFDLMDTEMKSFDIQLESLKTKFRRFYQRNDLHIKDMGEQVKAAFDEISQQIQIVVKNYHTYSKNVAKATNDWLLDMKEYPIAQKYAITIQQLMSGLKNVREVLEEALNDVTLELNKFSAVSYKKYLEISRAIDRKLQSYTRSLHELPIYRKMMEQKLRMGQIGIENIPGWAHFYNTVYLSGQQMLQDQYHDIMTRPEFQHIHAVVSEVHQQIMQWNMEQTVDAAVKRSIDLTKNLLLMELMKLRSYLIDLEKSRIIVYDPEQGELQFELHIPFALKSLTEAPEINVDKYVKDIKKWGQINLPSTNYSIWDTYYENVPSLELASYLPPFEASAYLIGGQHYITFDETHFNYLSTCSHVLTRDMISDNFSVVINYENKSQRDGVKSLCFTIENSLTFEILSDYRLEVNGRETEMPFISDRVKIIREGDFVHVQYVGGLDVYCNPKLELYRVTLKGWLHGHVAGLFGTYDNEPVNEKITNQLAQDFEVNHKSCLSKNSALTADPALDLDEMCTQIFDESISKFRPCFKQVNPTPFVQMCQIYMSKMTENEAIHLVTEQYRYVCKGHGIYIGPLKDYVPCNNEAPIIVEGIDPLYQSADVLFVLEDSACNQWASTALTSMATEINNALNTAGFKDNRFGLLGYGSLGSHDATVRTINGQHFGEVSFFLKATETLRLPKNSTTGDIANAVRLAVEYPFRTGVAKILILAPCSSCEVSFFERNMAGRLSSKGFVTHILKQQGYNYEDKNTNKKVKIYGVDNSKIYSNVLTPIKLKDVQGAEIINYCNTLVESTNGSLFDTTHLMNDKGRTQREFLQMFARRVGWGAALPPCQSCKCSVDSGQVECQLCSADMINYYLPWKGPSLVEAIGTLHDFNYDVQSYFGFAK